MARVAALARVCSRSRATGVRLACKCSGSGGVRPVFRFRADSIDCSRGTCPRASECSAHDREFVALAITLGAKPVTTEARIVRALPEIAVKLAER